MNNNFPRWSAPLIGAVVGALVGFRSGLRAQMPMPAFVLGGMAIGALAGSLIFLLDPVSARDSNVNSAAYLPAHLSSRVAGRPSGVVGRFLSVAGLFLCWFPVMGLIVNAAGLAVNWKSQDWAKKVSWIGLALAALFSIIFMVLVALDR